MVAEYVFRKAGGVCSIPGEFYWVAIARTVGIAVSWCGGGSAPRGGVVMVACVEGQTVEDSGWGGVVGGICMVIRVAPSGDLPTWAVFDARDADIFYMGSSGDVTMGMAKTARDVSTSAYPGLGVDCRDSVGSFLGAGRASIWDGCSVHRE